MVQLYIFLLRVEKGNYGLFADTPIRGQLKRGIANSLARRFAVIIGIPIIFADDSRKTFRGQAGLFADKLFEVTVTTETDEKLSCSPLMDRRSLSRRNRRRLGN